MKSIVREHFGDIRWAETQGSAPRVIIGSSDPLISVSSSYITVNLNDSATQVNLSYPRSDEHIVCSLSVNSDDLDNPLEGIMAFVAQPAPDKLSFYSGVSNPELRDRFLTALITKWKGQTPDWQEHLERAQALSFAPITKENLDSISESINRKAKEGAQDRYDSAVRRINEYQTEVNKATEDMYMAKRILDASLGLDSDDLLKQIKLIERQSMGVTIDDRRLVVYTKPLIAECNDERYDLGQIKFTLHLTAGSIAVEPFIGNCETRDIPHVMGSGNLCQGDQKAAIRDLLLQGKVYAAYAKVLGIVMYPNPDDDYGAPVIERYPHV